MRWFPRRTRVEGLRPEMILPAVEAECPLCFVSGSESVVRQHMQDYHSELKSWGVRVLSMGDYVVSCRSLLQATEVQDSLRERGIESKVVSL